MKILALDTSTQACSVALLEGTLDDYSLIERFEIAPRMHTQLILPMIDSVLNEAGYQIGQIDVLAFGRGPGAFTGVRVATGVVQAIAYGADLPVAQISSLAALAQAYLLNTRQGARNILVANDARMDEIYFGAYQGENNFVELLGQEKVLKPENLLVELNTDPLIRLSQQNQQWYILGNGWSIYSNQLETVRALCQTDHDAAAFEYPHAKYIAHLAFHESACGALVSADQVSPVYLRDNVAKKSQSLKV
jgi:tRNA threonylcarbamoyladenosine biosynthesis protein TsaB